MSQRLATVDLAISDLHHALDEAEAIVDRYAATVDRLCGVIARINHAIDHLDDELVMSRATHRAARRSVSEGARDE